MFALLSTASSAEADPARVLLHTDVHGSSAGSPLAPEESEHLGERRQGGLTWQAVVSYRDLSSLFEHVDLAQTPRGGRGVALGETSRPTCCPQERVQHSSSEGRASITSSD